VIFPTGMKGGARGKNDCMTYFGTQLKNEKEEVICDFLLKTNNDKLNKCSNPFVFLTYYHKGKLFY